MLMDHQVSLVGHRGTGTMTDFSLETSSLFPPTFARGGRAESRGGDRTSVIET